MQFLIVDDDAGYRRTLRYHLEAEWPDAAIGEFEPGATNALPDDEALTAADVILLGYPLQREQGFAPLQRLRARPGCPPIILFAVQSDEFLAIDGLKAGAADFFPKSRLQHQRLIESVRSQLELDKLAAARAAPIDSKALNGRVKHRVLSRLYAGDLSSVYLAQVESTGERIAFKVLRYVPDAGAGRTFERFLQEYEVIAGVQHPNVVRIFDLGIADDHAYLAMEYLSAGSLAQRLRAALDPAVAVDYTRQIASALKAIHDAGVLHRDLKPANIMFRADGTLAVIDFGLAKLLRLRSAITGTGQIFGTPFYMSPEQGHAEPTDERSDIYSLGCIFYEMLAGERPFVAPSPMGVIYQHAHSPRPQLGDALRHLQPALERMLAIDPAGRYQSAAELLEHLR